MFSPLLLASCLLAGFTAAQSLDGSWTMTIETPRGPMTSALVLKTEGESVTGTMTGPDGVAAPIKGTYTNDELTFSVTVNAPPGPIDLQMKGQVSGDEIRGTFSGGPVDGEFVAKRAG